MKLLLDNVISFFRQSRSKTAVYSLGLITEVAVECFYAVILKIVLDYIILPKNYRLFSIALLCFIASIVLYTASAVLRNLLYSKMYADLLGIYNNRLFNKIQQLSSSFFSKVRSGDLLSLFASDLESIETFYKLSVPACAFAIIKIFINTVIIFVLDWRLALLSIAGIAVAMFGPFPLHRKAVAVNSSLKDSKSQIISFTEENISAQGVIKSFNMHPVVKEIFFKKSFERSKLDAKLFFINSIILNSRLILFNIFTLALISIGAYMAMKGYTTAGTVVAFSTLFGALATSVRNISASLPIILDSTASIKRINDFLDIIPEIGDAPESVDLKEFSGSIAFKNVSFGYEDQDSTLKNFNLVIPRGASVAFVGHSGSGKSSILNLLLRFYDVKNGGILIDGHDIRSISQQSLHSIMSIVLQENFLFNTTISENLLFANPHASMEDIIKAARAAEIHDFIAGLPHGYSTVVGERGSKLSGGQRQRIALARALVCEPSILLLDEATSALDPKTEASINETLMRISQERTLIAVTHRLSSVKDYDMIVVMEKGRIAECGSHHALLDNKGAYHRLWEKQQGFVVDQSLEYAEIEAGRLSKLPLFKHLSHALQQMVAELFISEHYAPDRTIIDEGDSGDKFYIIVRGQVEVLKGQKDGSVRKIAVLQDGDHFGEIALLRNIPRTATVRTLTPCLLLSLQRKKFIRVIETAPGIKEAIEKEAAARNM